KALQNRIAPSAEVEKFADNASVEQVWERLTSDRHRVGIEESDRINNYEIARAKSRLNYDSITSAYRSDQRERSHQSFT
ncbi:MAG TPA: hypothetical protein DD990_20550, partial [Cyanobacteria bacterium UBA11368]|nr:hypothetical protein [Cyanobacteria bacterium UBA11368]